MNYLELPVGMGIVIVIVLGWIAGYIQAKIEPIDASALYLAHLTTPPEMYSYMTPGQRATIFFPTNARNLRSLSSIFKLCILVLAILTTWWIWFFGALARSIATTSARRLWADWRFSSGVFAIIANLEIRKTNYLKKGDRERASTCEELIDEIRPHFEEAHVSQELVPPRMETAKVIGLRQSL